MNCGSIFISQEPSWTDAVDCLGTAVTTVPDATTYTVKCSDIRHIESPSVYDVIQNLDSGFSAQINPDGSISFKSATLMPNKRTEEKEKEDMQRVTIPMPTKILKNGRATVVFFADDTKVVVKLPDGVEDNDYNAFCAAITKKMFGTNTRIKSKMKDLTEVVMTPQEKRLALKKAREEGEARRQEEIDKKVRRMAHQMVLEKRAKQLAKEMMDNV